MKPWISLLIAIAATAFGASLGYAYSQTQLAKIVAVNTKRLDTIEVTLDKFEKRSTDHMNQAIDLFEKQIEVQREFINTIKVQNEVLVKLVNK